MITKQHANCPTCNSGMEIEEVLLSRTTSPDEDDQFRDMYFCDSCNEYFPIISSEEE